jgi:hypothetical protein
MKDVGAAGSSLRQRATSISCVRAATATAPNSLSQAIYASVRNSTLCNQSFRSARTC